MSPQRLIYYRENWLLDTWCHKANGIRTFGVEAIRKAKMLDERARDVPEKELDAAVKEGYGIFGGKAIGWAKLRFSPMRARWVCTELWHEQQKSRFDSDGTYVLEIPFSDDRELVMDIMRYGPDVEVLAPPSLRSKVRDMHVAAAGKYAGKKARSSGA